MRWFGTFFMSLVGLIFLSLAGWWGWESWSFTQGAEPAQGRIEHLEKQTSTKRRSGTTRTRTYYAPVFSFRDAQGASHTVKSSVSSGEPAYEVGEEVKVLYQPANPSTARINTFSEFWLFPAAFAGFGILCFVAARLKRRQR